MPQMRNVGMDGVGSNSSATVLRQILASLGPAVFGLQ